MSVSVSLSKAVLALSLDDVELIQHCLSAWLKLTELCVSVSVSLSKAVCWCRTDLALFVSLAEIV